MPTRIVLQNTSFPSKVALAPNHVRNSQGSGNNDNNARRSQQQRTVNLTTPPRPALPTAPPRSVLNFRSSILRELAENTNSNSNIPANNDTTATNNNNNVNHNSFDRSNAVVRNAGTTNNETPDDSRKIRLSKDDIRASPRLTGYLFTMIAAAVLLVSVVQFYKELDSDANDIPTKFFVTKSGALVFKWKVLGALYASGIGCLLSFSTLLVHFDTIILPKLWVYIFRDGSLSERHWIWFLLFFWVGSVHVCTSTLSIGELQPNVFFTTWIAFGSMISTYEVWRESAGLTGLSIPSSSNSGSANGLRGGANNGTSGRPRGSISDAIAPIALQPDDEERQQQTQQSPVDADSSSSFRCETTHNWIWTAFFSFLFACSVADVYHNRDFLEIEIVGFGPMRANPKDWFIVLSVVWTEALVCVLAIILNESLPTNNATGLLPCRFRSCRRTSANNDVDDQIIYRCVFGWRQIEGLVIFISAALKFWIILTYTGVDDVISGLSNAYFGVWGSFFNSVFTFGTWLRENKNTEYIIRESRPINITNNNNRTRGS